MNVDLDKRIVDSWIENARPWSRAVREGTIESRVLVTDRAILDAVLARSPRSVLDAGCGEGWLVRALARAGVDALGIDVVPDLVDRARAEGGGRFGVMSFEDVADGALRERFDVVVANFSLLGDACVARFFRRVPALLTPGGAFVVQTVHPGAASDDGIVADGWREESWARFEIEFRTPSPWYFRTRESWTTLFAASGLTLDVVAEPVHPHTGLPTSTLFVGVLAA